jgi:predicted dehydrogenase
MNPGVCLNSRNGFVNVAVVGLGLMGVTHLKAYQQIEGVRIIALADSSRMPVNGVLAGANGNTGGAEAIHLGDDVRMYRDIGELLACPDIHLVSLCTPTQAHAAQAIAALKAGKHVICEKPLARSSAMARAIVTAAKTAPGYFMPAMCMRFWPGWSGLKALAVEQTYGCILSARFRRVSAPPAWGRKNYFNGAESGGALLDLHIHDTDFVQYLFGRPLGVFSTGQSVFSGAIDHVVTQYRVAGGATVYAEGSWLQTAGFSMSYTVNFERATLDFDSLRGGEALLLTEEGKLPKTLPLDAKEGYLPQLQHMVHSIRAGSPPTIVTAEEALQAVEICEAEEQSVISGKEILLA